MTLVHLALVFIQTANAPVHAGYVYREGAIQENAVRFDPIPEPKLSPVQKTALVLNMPALLAALPFAGLFFPGSDSGVLWAAVPFVTLLWYWVGRWIDLQLGYISSRPKPNSSVRTVARWLAVLCTGFLLTLSLISITPINHHHRGDAIWYSAAGIFWWGLLFLMSVSTFRRAQARGVAH